VHNVFQYDVVNDEVVKKNLSGKKTLNFFLCLWHDSIINYQKTWKILENLGKKLPNQKAESCPNWIGQAFISPPIGQDFFPRLFSKTLSQDFAKKAAFFEAFFFGKSWRLGPILEKGIFF
jgi:hypothetical protein